MVCFTKKPKNVISSMPKAASCKFAIVFHYQTFALYTATTIVWLFALTKHSFCCKSCILGYQLHSYKHKLLNRDLGQPSHLVRNSPESQGGYLSHCSVVIDHFYAFSTERYICDYIMMHAI